MRRQRVNLILPLLNRAGLILGGHARRQAYPGDGQADFTARYHADRHRSPAHPALVDARLPATFEATARRLELGRPQGAAEHHTEREALVGGEGARKRRTRETASRRRAITPLGQRDRREGSVSV